MLSPQQGPLDSGSEILTRCIEAELRRFHIEPRPFDFVEHQTPWCGRTARVDLAMERTLQSADVSPRNSAKTLGVSVLQRFREGGVENYSVGETEPMERK